MDSISIIFLRFDYTLEKKIRIFLLLKFATFGTDIVHSAIGEPSRRRADSNLHTMDRIPSNPFYLNLQKGDDGESSSSEKKELKIP